MTTHYYVYIVLDSFTKLRDSRSEAGEFRWDFVLGVSTAGVSTVRDIVDVVEVQVGAFQIPLLSDAEYPTTPPGVTLVPHSTTSPPNPPLLPAAQYPAQLASSAAWIHNPYGQLPYGGRLTAQIREFGSQAVLGRTGPYHFGFTAQYNAAQYKAAPNSVTVVPDVGFDTFCFAPALAHLRGITVVLRNPDTPVHFEPDCMYNVYLQVTGNYLVFAAAAHGLSVGDRIHVSGYRSGCAALDVYINRADGHVVDSDPSASRSPGAILVGADRDRFWTDPAVAITLTDIGVASNSTLAQHLCTVYIAKRRIRIPMRFKCTTSRS
jgi:hypothetical protein